MRLGRMNHPARSIADEIDVTAALGFDYLELTLEPPRATAATIDAADIARRLDDAGLGVVGHTAYWLPIADPFPRLRQAAIDQLREDLDALAAAGCDRVTIHPHRGGPLGYTDVDRLKLQADSYASLIEHARPLGLSVMLENLLGFLGDPLLLRRHVFDPLPDLKLNLDLAHAGVGVAEHLAPRFLELLGDRLHHLHVCDNNGLADLHLPVGAGVLPLRELVRAVRAFGYDEGCTLEVFSADSSYARHSAATVRGWLDEP